jgi:glycine oxidase
VTIAVAGAGIVGCVVAYELARRGYRVEVFDPRQVGGGATRATAGVIAPFIEAPAGGPLRDLTLKSFRLYDAFIRDLHDNSKIAVEYRSCGTLELVETPDDEQRLEAVAGLARAAGFEAGVRDMPAQDDVPALRGLFIPAQGYVRAEQLIQALRHGAEARGARFHEGQRVLGIEALPTGCTVRTDERRIGCDAVVIAAGSWSDSLGLDPVGVRPIRGQLLRLRWGGQPPPCIIWAHDCYIVPWTDGTVLVGATVEDAGFDERATVEGVRGLLRAVSRILPEARNATFIEARAGLRPASADGLPVMRSSADSLRVIYATGHYRNGILLAPLTAQRIASLVGAVV